MGRMSKLFDQASNAVADLELHTEKSVTDFVARVQKAKDRTDGVMLKKHQHIDNHMTDLAEFEKDLTEFDGKNEHSDAGENTEQAASWRPTT